MHQGSRKSQSCWCWKLRLTAMNPRQRSAPCRAGAWYISMRHSQQPGTLLCSVRTNCMQTMSAGRISHQTASNLQYWMLGYNINESLLLLKVSSSKQISVINTTHVKTDCCWSFYPISLFNLFDSTNKKTTPLKNAVSLFDLDKSAILISKWPIFRRTITPASTVEHTMPFKLLSEMFCKYWSVLGCSLRNTQSTWRTINSPQHLHSVQPLHHVLSPAPGHTNKQQFTRSMAHTSHVKPSLK